METGVSVIFLLKFVRGVVRISSDLPPSNFPNPTKQNPKKKLEGEGSEEIRTIRADEGYSTIE